MNPLRLLCSRWFLGVCALLVILPARAQLDDYAVKVPVTFGASASGIPAGGDPLAFDAWLNTTHIGASSPGTGRITMNVPPKAALLYIGREYDLTTSTGDYWDTATVDLQAPGGFELLVNGIPRRTVTLGNGGWATVMVRRLGATSFVSQDRLPTIGKVVWEIALGQCCDGSAAGVLNIHQDSVVGVFTPGALHYAGDASAEVDVVYSSGVIRQVKTLSRLADIVTLTASSYEVRLYASGDYGITKVAGVYPVNVGATPYTKYLVQDANADGKTMRITQTTGTETEVAELYFDAASQQWTRTLFHNGAVQSVTTQTQISASPRTVEISVANSAGTVAEKTRATYTTFSGGGVTFELITQQVRDVGGANYTSQTTYYTNPSYSGSYLQKQTETFSDGSWIKYEYYEASTTARHGLLYRTYQPFKDTPADPSGASTTSGVLTTYDYSNDSDVRLRRLLISQVKTIDGQLVARTTNTYALEAMADGKTNIVKTTWDYFGTGTSDYLVTVVKSFDPGLPSAFEFYRGKRHSVTEPTGKRTSYLHQRGSYSPTTFTAGTGNWSRVLKLTGTSANAGGGRQVQYFDTTGNILEALWLYPGQSMLTAEIRDAAGNMIRSEDWVLVTGTGGTTVSLADFNLVSWSSRTFDVLDHQLTRATELGTEYTATYQNGRLKDETDLAGTKVEYTWEDFGRLMSTKKLGVNNAYSVQGDLTTSHTYDAAGRILTTTVSGGGTEQFTSISIYNLAGQITQTTDANGTVRTWGREKVGADTHYTLERVRVQLAAGETYADGTSTYSEVVTTKHRDGRVKDVTGSGTVPAYFEYSVPQAGQFKRKTLSASATSPRYAEAVEDMLGRNVSVTTPKFGGGTLTATQVYTAGTGLLEKSVTPGQGDRYYFYDQFGRLKREGLDADATAGLQDASASDRITEYDSRFVKVGTDWWLQAQSFGFAEPGSSTKILLSRTRERLTGFTGNVTSETYGWGINPNPATLETALTGRAGHVTTKVFSTDKRLETYVDSPDATADAFSRSVNGLPVASVSAAGAQVTTAYDALLRVSQVDQATGNSDSNLGPVTVSQQFEYFTGQARLKKRKEKNASGTWITSLEQDFYGDGSVKWAKNTEGRYTRLDYNPRGQVLHRWGDGVTPEQNYYDTYGDLQHLYTYRGGSGWDTATLPGAFSSAASDGTTWARDAATGLLTQKTDAANKTESWGFDAYNRATSHAFTRGTGTITATLTLDPKTAELTAQTYSDGTPTLGFTYNRLGQTRTVSDVTGTRTLTYRTGSDYQLEDEALDATFYGTDLHLRTRFNASLASARAEGYTLGVATGPGAAFSSTHLDVTYGFDPANERLTSLQANTRNATKNHTFTFGYLGNTALLRQTDGPQSTVWKRAYEPYRAALKTTSIERGATTYASYALTRDDLSRVTTETQSGQMFTGYGTANNLTITYAYDTRGQLATAETKVNNNSVSLSERYFAATYDNAANRATENRYSTSTSSSYRETYTPTALNQYSTKTVRNAVEVGGQDTVGGSITLTYSTAGTATATKPGSGQYWRAELNRAGATESMQLASVYRNGSFYTYAPYAQRTATENLTWDNAGNLTGNTQFTLTYDAEDRLVEIKDKTDADIRKTIAYDYQGRRVEEKDYNASGSLTRWRRFVWSGWALLAEVDVNVSTQAKTIRRTFVWGPDLSGSIHGVAGIGGLLLIDRSTTQQWVVGSDGRGNVTALLDALATDTGTPANNLKAGIEYTPYGEVVRSQGSFSEVPFRFQSKWALGQTWEGSWSVEFLDFGRRAYSPSLGRFLSRDPAGEAAGANLYHYCHNDPINVIDPLGLDPEELPGQTIIGTRLPTLADILNRYRSRIAMGTGLGAGYGGDNAAGSGIGGETGEKEKENEECNGKEKEKETESGGSRREGGPEAGAVNEQGESEVIGRIALGRAQRAVDNADDDTVFTAGMFITNDHNRAMGATVSQLSAGAELYVDGAMTLSGAGDVALGVRAGVGIVRNQGVRGAIGSAATWIRESAGTVAGWGRSGVAWVRGLWAGGAASSIGQLVLTATRNPTATTVVLGRTLEGGVSYLNVAARYNATYFKLEDRVWNSLTAGLSRQAAFNKVWPINEAFIREQFSQGKMFLFSHDPASAIGFFKAEVDLLNELGRDLGISFVKDGDVWKAVMQCK